MRITLRIADRRLLLRQRGWCCRVGSPACGDALTRRRVRSGAPVFPDAAGVRGPPGVGVRSRSRGSVPRWRRCRSRARIEKSRFGTRRFLRPRACFLAKQSRAVELHLRGLCASHWHPSMEGPRLFPLGRGTRRA